MAPPSLPKRVKVGPHIYEIKWKRRGEVIVDGESCLASHDGDALEVCVERGRRRSVTQENVIHEFLHAIFPPGSVEYDVEEHIVLHLGKNLLSLLRENKELVRYLTE